MLDIRSTIKKQTDFTKRSQNWRITYLTSDEVVQKSRNRSSISVVEKIFSKMFNMWVLLVRVFFDSERFRLHLSDQSRRWQAVQQRTII